MENWRYARYYSGLTWLRFWANIFRTFIFPSLFLCSVSGYGQKMQYGDKSLIDYHPEKGTFDIYVDGKIVLKNAYSEAMLNSQLISSRNAHGISVRKNSFRNSMGKGQRYTFTLKFRSGLNLVQSFLAFTNRNFFVIELSVKGSALSSNQLFPLKGELVESIPFTNYNALFVPFDNDAFIRYRADSLLPGKDNTSAEVTSIYDNEKRKGFVIGTLDQDQWKTSIKTTLISRYAVDLVVQCGFTHPDISRDKLEHGYIHANEIKSSKILFGYFSDWRIGMEDYSKTLRAHSKPLVADWKGPTPVGWNSWGAMQKEVSLEKVKSVVDFFAKEMKHFRVDDVCYIDLDSYWDNMMDGDSYTQLKQFADYCKANRLKPGIYWAPFTDWGFRSGGGRKAKGSSYNYGEMWTKVKDEFHDFDGARALDPTHPGTQMRIKYMISNFKKCGFEMIKLDFLGHAAVESSRFYDPNISTGMQAYKVGMEYLLKCLDNKMLVYAAISPNLASGRYIQVRRIACDAFKSINDTEYTLNSLTYGWWQTHLYNYIDADHVVLGEESEAANTSRMLSAIVTGTFITGDDFSRSGEWKASAKLLFQNPDLLQVIKDGKAFRPVEGVMGSGASNLFVKASGKYRYIAIFNYENKISTSTLDFLRMGIDEHSIDSMQNLITHQIINVKDYRHKELRPNAAAIFKITLK